MEDQRPGIACLSAYNARYERTGNLSEKTFYAKVPETFWKLIKETWEHGTQDQLSKLLYELNRDTDMQAAFKADAPAVADRYPLTDEERGAVLGRDIGLLYVLGVNGQILMHFAAFAGSPGATIST